MSETATPALGSGGGCRPACAPGRRPGRRADLRARGQPLLRHPGLGGAGPGRRRRGGPRRRRRAAARPGGGTGGRRLHRPARRHGGGRRPARRARSGRRPLRGFARRRVPAGLGQAGRQVGGPLRRDHHAGLGGAPAQHLPRAGRRRRARPDRRPPRPAADGQARVGRIRPGRAEDHPGRGPAGGDGQLLRLRGHRPRRALRRRRGAGAVGHRPRRRPGGAARGGDRAGVGRLRLRRPGTAPG